MFPFGSYPLNFPSSLISGLLSVNDTSLGSIVYPDDNISMLHRQHAVVPTEISSDEGLNLLEEIRKALLKTQIFQLRGENCAFWAQNTSEKINIFKLKNPFKINLTQSNTFSFIGKIPARYQPKLLNALDFFLGERRGLTIEENGQKVFKSISLIPQEEKMYIYQPGWLHEQILAGTLSGRIYTGAP
ncbi:MAG: hypothetical protein H0X29_10260 [Parachlamydiaceae bacterium]|nr:hypothetical protein [Parachlamydiaceae bacterium]